MRAELDDLLCQRYPEMFRDRHGDRTNTAMCWGFCCGDGWFGVIDELCADITAEVRAGTTPPVVVLQVKEKFGTLRFRVRGGSVFGGNATVRQLIQRAQSRAASTCEQCGKPGESMGIDRWEILCPTCAAAWSRSPPLHNV